MELRESLLGCKSAAPERAGGFNPLNDFQGVWLLGLGFGLPYGNCMNLGHREFGRTKGIG
jgi:hypothetical protein